MQNSKINTALVFPPTLDLKDFSFRNQHGQTEAFEDQQLKSLLEKEDNDFVYRLVGVNIHAGNGQHGHYYSFINTNRRQTGFEKGWTDVEDDIWRKFDDETISTFNYDDIAKECYGGEYASSGTSNFQG